jgi:Na+-transporting NADH:ubiquinone oxidoreductase subunit F
VKEWECTVISNKNVSSFIKEFKVALPPGEHMDFIPGSYAQIKIPAYDCIDYDKDFDKSILSVMNISVLGRSSISSPSRLITRSLP